MIPFPNISPEIFSFSIGSFQVALRWYAVSYILGFMCALFIMKNFISNRSFWNNNNPPMVKEDADNILTYLILGVILGGRLGYVLFYNLEYYISNPTEIIKVWDGGMAFHGGFLGVVIAVIFYARIHKLSIWSVSDLIALSSPPGLLFGRVANFINAELWGRPTDLPWGVIFPGERAQDCGQVDNLCARHSSQLYEACLEGFFLFIILLLLAYRGGLKYPGFITGVFAIGYGASRFLVEYFRVPDPQFFSAENPNGFAYQLGQFGITMGQVLSLPMIITGTFLLFYASISRKKPE